MRIFFLEGHYFLDIQYSTVQYSTVVPVVDAAVLAFGHVVGGELIGVGQSVHAIIFRTHIYIKYSYGGSSWSALLFTAGIF